MSESPRAKWRETLPHGVSELLKDSHYDSVFEVLKENEGRPYKELTQLVGGIPPIQLIKFAYDEARHRDDVRYVALDGLCRNIVENCSSGWNCGPKSDWNQIKALSCWITEVSVTGGHSELKGIAESIAAALRQTSPSERNWVPLDNRDEHLQRLFDMYWR